MFVQEVSQAQAPERASGTPATASNPRESVPNPAPVSAQDAGCDSKQSPVPAIRAGDKPGGHSTLGGRLRRSLLLTAGILSVALGLLGVVLPVLPTTPFLLLAAACFLRSSERMHRWLLSNRVFGEYLRRYRNGEGLPLSSKVTTIVFLWGTLGASALFAVPPRLWWVRLVLMAVGLGVTIHILRIKTRRS